MEHDTVDTANKLGEQQVTQPAAPTSLNIHAIGTHNGVPIIDLDPSTDFQEQPWRRPGADLADYFNYGFDEQTWREYCQKQKVLRDEAARGRRLEQQYGGARRAQTGLHMGGDRQPQERTTRFEARPEDRTVRTEERTSRFDVKPEERSSRQDDRSSRYESRPFDERNRVHEDRARPYDDRSSRYESRNEERARPYDDRSRPNDNRYGYNDQSSRRDTTAGHDDQRRSHNVDDRGSSYRSSRDYVAKSSRPNRSPSPSSRHQYRPGMVRR